MESTPPEHYPQDLGTMVGLFWREPGKTYLGMSPLPPAPGVLLSPAGTAGPRARAANVAAAALNAWVPGSPAEMTVVIASGGNEYKTPVLSGASSAYTQWEVDLSQGLLAHLVRGTTSPVVPSDWWNENRWRTDAASVRPVHRRVVAQLVQQQVRPTGPASAGAAPGGRCR